MTTFFTVLVFAILTLLVVEAFFGMEAAMKVSTAMKYGGMFLMAIPFII